MLKNLDKKYLYILGGLIIFPLLIIIFLVIVRGCSGNNSYDKYENKMVKAAENYFKKKNSLPITEGGLVEVSLDDLVSGKYIDSTDKFLSDSSCSGSVTVRNNGGHYQYIPDLKCDKYSTVHIIDKLMEDLVESKSGLYSTDDGYVYKGAKVNNYILLSDKKYRVLSIDRNGILKLVKVDSEKIKVNWDNKFNTERKRISGKNDYSDSNIIDELNNKYLKMSDKHKKHLIGYNVCYGNRSSSHRVIDKTEECSKVLNNQFLSVLNTYDYAMASYDPECVNISSGSCRNYNYLYKTLELTWLMNGVADNSYEVYYYSTGSIEVSYANSSRKYNLVIYVDGRELYTDGDGTNEKPYVIK